MRWKQWRIGAIIAVILSLLVAGAGLTAGMTWQCFVAVFCAACITHLGAWLKDHPIESVSFDSNPQAFIKTQQQPVTPDNKS